MKYSLTSFYGDFYGLNFFRHFRRLYDFKGDKVRRQFTVKDPKQLYLHVDRNSGHHACMIHVYDHGSYDNLNGQDHNSIWYDRAFFDFDVENPEVKQLKKQLIPLREHGPHYKVDLQAELKQQLQDLIIDGKVAEPAITEAKQFSREFKEAFGSAPALFFSGCKGCHAYTFFNPSKYYNIDTALSWFTEQQKGNYSTLDLAVAKDATSRLSRVPYSKHQLTDLAVVPFTLKDNYRNIMRKAFKPTVRPFDQFNYFSSFDEHLQKIDRILKGQRKSQEAKRRQKLKLNPRSRAGRNVEDHRTFFRAILGEPERSYPDKDYVMYNCPFKDHEDHNPSFRVHKTGYYCYGCHKHGNYFQFLKDYNHWTNRQVKEWLKKNKMPTRCS